MLNLYTDKSFLIPEHRGKVFPLLLDLYYKECNIINKYYSITALIEQADIIVLPLEYNYIKSLKPEIKLKYLTLAREHNIPLWIYTGGDFGYSFKEEEIFTFRLGGFHSKLNANTFIMPSFIVDPYEYILKSEFNTIKKNIKPTIGFVGHAHISLFKGIKEYLLYLKVNILKRKIKKEHIDYQSFYPSSIKRAFILKKLEDLTELTTHFIYREKYRGGVQTELDKINKTLEFFKNIEVSGYTFCLRGVGNFSVRLYETLAMGRIPVLIDTDCRLPLDWKIDWTKHIVLVKSANAEVINKTIIDFHNQLSSSDFITLQSENRTLWRKYMNRNAFFKEIHDVFK
ncbi:exostosin family protein [Formosa sediminum]|uniref:Exostosin family protein n=1 Tax=Formosa sediminum TaxID=2594004 RepID=A0A516GRN7_9FLAO|nr:exostosin family protein [Formosa sediminum]QDO94184.1 exostosin family protein [Formosa sediminum]